MALSCGSKVLKYLIFITNSVVCIAGVFFLVLAIRLLADPYLPEGFPKVPGDVTIPRGSLIFLAVFSVLTFFIGFLGCFGALNERRGMLLAYSLIMFLFIVLIIAAQVAVASGYKTFEKGVEDGMTELYKNETSRQNFTEIEKAFDCCGASLELKDTFIKEGLCRIDGQDWSAKPACSQVILKGVGVWGLVGTLILLFAAIVAMGASCCLRSAVVDRGSYVEFS